jgi:glycerol-3-phosphate dehydrogenase (NAD(P)+)
MNVTIIGAGAFGGALGKILDDNGHAVLFFDNKEPHLTLEEATEPAEVIVIAIPSEAVGEFAGSLPARLRKLPVILAVKGLLSLGIFADFERFSVLGGSAFAVDIVEGLPVVFTVTDELARQLFENEQVKVELTDDALGVELCGSLKNIYAIGAGALVQAQAQTQAYLEQALAEMKRYLTNHGALAATADLACGIGDLMMTATSEKSRNLRFGKALAAGRSAEEARRELGTVEGLETLAQVDREGYPIIAKIYELVRATEAK